MEENKDKESVEVYKVLAIYPDGKLPNVWQNTPDSFESQGVKWKICIINVNEITEVGWTVNNTRKRMEKLFKKGGKLPLCLLEKINGIYKLCDGQHRFKAYCNVFPNIEKIKVAYFTGK
jgi:hypothetical protein